MQNKKRQHNFSTRWTKNKKHIFSSSPFPHTHPPVLFVKIPTCYYLAPRKDIMHTYKSNLHIEELEMKDKQQKKTKNTHLCPGFSPLLYSTFSLQTSFPPPHIQHSYTHILYVELIIIIIIIDLSIWQTYSTSKQLKLLHTS